MRISRKQAAGRSRSDKRIAAARGLCEAAMRGELAEVRRLVEREGVDVNARDARHHTPLIHAATNGRAKVVRYLLERGADVNLSAGKKSDGDSPLIAAVYSGKLAVVRLMTEAGADLGYAPKAYPRDTALRQAKEGRLTEIVDYLLGAQEQRAGGAGGRSGGAGTKKRKPAGRPGTPRGVTTFDTTDSMVLVAAAAVGDVSSALARRVGATDRRENVMGDEVKLTRRCYAVWKVVDSPWTVVMKLYCRDFKHWPSAADAAAMSKSLRTAALYVANSDTGGVTQYVLFERGEVAEIFSYGGGPDDADVDAAAAALANFAKTSALDVRPLVHVSAGDGKLFASSRRRVDVRKIDNDLDFVNDYVTQQEAFVPFGFDGAFGGAGETAELTVEGLAPGDVERLDYVAVK